MATTSPPETGRPPAARAASLVAAVRALLSGTRGAYAVGELSNAATLAPFAVLARLLGVEPYGEFVTIIAVSAILSTGVEFGFHTLLTRTVAREPERARRELWEAHRRQILLAPLLLGAMYGYLSSPAFHQRDGLRGF